MPGRPETSGRSRSETAADWIGWHLLELLAVGVPAVLAVALAGWLVLLSVAAGVLWVGAELRLARRARPAPLDAGPRRAQLVGGSKDETDRSGPEHRSDGPDETEGVGA